VSDEQLDQDEIERLLNGGASKPPQSTNQSPPGDSETVDQAAIQALMAGVTGKTLGKQSVDDAPLQQGEIEALMAGAGSQPTTPEPDSYRDAPLGQDEIEALLAGGTKSPAVAPKKQQQPAANSQTAAPSIGRKAGTATRGSNSAFPQSSLREKGGNHGLTPPPISLGSDINVLLEQAEQAIRSINEPIPVNSDARPFQLADFSGSTPNHDRTSLDLLRDVELELKIELGRTRMHLDEMMKLKSGSVVSLDKLAGDPVDIYVNGRMIARGEVLVFNDNFCVRVAELISGDDV